MISPVPADALMLTSVTDFSADNHARPSGAPTYTYGGPLSMSVAPTYECGGPLSMSGPPSYRYGAPVSMSATQMPQHTRASMRTYVSRTDNDHLLKSIAPTEVPDSLLATSRSLTSCRYEMMPPPRVSLHRPPTIVSRIDEFPVPQPPSSSNADCGDSLMVTTRSLRCAVQAPKAMPMTVDQAKLPRLSPSPNITMRNRNTRRLGHFTRESLKHAKAQLAVPRVQLMADRFDEGRDVLSYSMTQDFGNKSPATMMRPSIVQAPLP
eukprot:GEMP01010247.1.p1 GENE.GEMP01010247.1~~GEMP01010247.1.p1  ORF type:complete len:265 (-),score=64.17 GEMP01010247.1:2374-3168(-)